MIVAELMGILEDANPEAPVFLGYCELVFEADSASVQNGQVHIQGYEDE